MSGSTRTVRFAIAVFATVTVLVLGGLIWATVASLQLERATQETQAAMREAEAQSNLRKNLELARLHLESIVRPVLMREASRSYKEYAPIPKNEEDFEEGDPEDQPRGITNIESWILLHFQVTEDLCWTSPQLPPVARHAHDGFSAFDPETGEEVPARITCAEADLSDPVAVERQELLEQLAAAYSPEDFAKEIEAGWTACQRHFLPPMECEPSQRVQRIIRGVETPPEGTEEGFLPVQVNEMACIELLLLGGDAPKVALVRQVDIGNDRVFQGLVIDLAELSAALAPRVKGLWEYVKLQPVDAPLAPHEAATQLGLLPPVRLVAPEPGPAAKPPPAKFVRTTVAFAWITAVIALIAIGLGVKRLVTLTERRREFTYAVTHELRTPLTTFQLYTDMLAAELVPEEKKASYLSTMHQESQRLSDLITEVLEFSRIESDAVRAHLRNHHVRELMDTVRQRYESRCRAAGMALVFETDDTGDRPLYTDPDIALQILGTLIDNACKYASKPEHPPGGESDDQHRASPTVRLRVIDTGSKLAIEVTDNGPGISPKDRHDLFKPFHRGRPENVSHTGGVGLGLALAKRWTRLIRGYLELVDRPEQRGACFRLTLPVGSLQSG